MHMMFIAIRLGVAPSQGHTGFDKIVTGKDSAVDIGIYNHYLHHKYFEVNYSDGIIPLDKIFGSFHDGSVEADKKMQERLDTYNLGNEFN
jgi:sterol desaturase/sphingolipid hydroxylase (fatty acid hydroxylase superfamily)